MKAIEEVIGYRFKDQAILHEALTHKSFASEHRHARYNERLEFLGDSVLGLITAHFVYRCDPDCVEGRLSKLKSRLVSRTCLSEWAREIEIGNYLNLGQGEAATGGRQRDSNLANSMEAVIGAIYLDGGFAEAEKFVVGWLEHQPLIEDGADHKSALQEMLQKKHKTPPTYDIAQTVGPEHDKTFTVIVSLGGKTLGKGKGKNKKEAEQAAANDAMERLKTEEL